MAVLQLLPELISKVNMMYYDFMSSYTLGDIVHEKGHYFPAHFLSKELMEEEDVPYQQSDFFINMSTYLTHTLLFKIYMYSIIQLSSSLAELYLNSPISLQIG